MVANPKPYWRFVDAIGDPINNSVTLVLIKKAQFFTFYGITLDESLEISEVHSYKVSPPASLNMHDYNFMMSVAACKEEWKSVGTTSKTNGFDLIYEQGAGKVCSIINSDNEQFVFFDDLKNKTTRVVRLKY